MPFGDPRPTRRKAGLGRRATSASRQSPSPDPVRIGQMLHELIEMAPTVVYGTKEVMCGAREPLAPPVPDCPKSAVLDVMDRDTGILYQVIVVPHESPNAR